MKNKTKKTKTYKRNKYVQGVTIPVWAANHLGIHGSTAIIIEATNLNDENIVILKKDIPPEINREGK